MSKKVLGLDLSAVTMPEAIAAMVDAWLDAQNVASANKSQVNDQPDEIRLSDWWKSRQISRSTAFRLIRAADIEPVKRRVAGVRTPVTCLTRDQIQTLDSLAGQLQKGLPFSAIAVEQR